MARPKKAARSESATTAEETGTATDETSAIENWKIFDYITGKLVAENDKERVRQRIAHALFFDESHKYIESPDLVAGLAEVVREMCHKGKSITVASTAVGGSHW